MPIPEGWNPQYSEQQTRKLLDQYKGRAHYLTEAQQESLQQHAEGYNIPYFPGDFSILDAIKQAGAGFFQGFTTFTPPGEGPDHEFESIARSIGHLVGFAPGILSGPLRAAATVTKSATLLHAARATHKIRNLSAPMMAAGLATRQAKRLIKPAFKAASKAQAGAAQSAARMITTGAVPGILEGAFHLGVASSVSHWREGIDAMMSAGISGAAFGGAFKGIGNIAPHIAKLMGSDSEAASKAISTLAGSMLMGLPETARGATTSEQIYSYLLGAYFGGKELPYTVQAGHKFYNKMQERADKDKPFEATFDPEAMPEWPEQSQGTQKVVRDLIDKRMFTLKQRSSMGYELLKEVGMEGLIPKERFTEDFKSTGKVVKGEEQMVVEDKAHPIFHHGISDASKGAASEFAKIAKDFGHPFVHYVFKGAMGSRPQTIPRGLTGTLRPLGETDLSEANEAVSMAQRALGRDISKMGAYKLNLFRRTYHAVKYANAVYGIAPLETKGEGIPKSVKDGTGWGAQMAIQMRKPVFIFSPEAMQWYQYNYKSGMFVPHEGVPKLTDRYAGIGMQNIPPTGIEAIRKLFAENVDPIIPEGPVTPDTEIESAEASSASRPGLQMELFPDVENNDIDIGSKLKHEIGKTSVQFVNKHMTESWRSSDIAPEMRASVKLDLANKLEESIQAYLNPDKGGTKTGGVEAWAKVVDKDMGYSLSEEAKGDMRKWMRRKNYDKQVKYFSAMDMGTAGIDIGLMSEYSPFTKAGTSKNIYEPEKLIETIYKNAGGAEEMPLIILDTITAKTANGNKDFSLSRYRNNYLNSLFKGNEQQKATQVEKRWNSSMGRIFSYLNRQANMYAFGGANDKDKLYFVKFHPSTNVKSDFAEVSKALGSKIMKEYNQANTKFYMSFGATSPKGAAMSHKEAMDLHKKAFVSNIRYDLDFSGLPFTAANIKKLKGDGFMHGATEYNKRLQILMTSNYEHAPPNKEHVPDLDNGMYKYQLIEEKPDKNAKIDTINSKRKESTDGSIVGRDDVVDALNRDFGVIKTGQDKSFIVSKDPEGNFGALLGKYMIHKAGAKQSADMLKKKQHFKIYDSSAKQTGGRKFNKDYFMKPSDIRGGSSTAATKEMLDPQIWVKPLFTVLGPTNFKPTAKKIIDDIEMSVIRERVKGNEGWNTELTLFKEKPTATRMDALLKNIEQLGVNELFDVMTGVHGPEVARFSEQAYAKIARRSLELADHMLRSGEIDEVEARAMKAEVEEANSVVDVMLKEGRRALDGAKKRGEDITGLGLYQHKFVAKWRAQTVKNWIVKQVTRPKVSNSMLSFMRPYDDYLIKDADGANPRLKKLNEPGNTDIFFLDDHFKELKLKTSIKGFGKTTLGKLWDKYDSKTAGFEKGNKAKAEEVFEAIAVRVPLDSVSGAQVLKFQGFTGRDGHGVLLHGKVMGALGGADLDGDEAFVYFGDEAHGMKKAWKKTFKDNKDEYVNPDKTISKAQDAIVNVGFNKNRSMKDVFVRSGKDSEELQNSIGWQWSPYQRINISQRVVEGRNMLGAVVSNAQVLRSAHASVIGTPRGWKGRTGVPAGSDRFEFYRGDDSYRITYTAKTDPEWQKLQRSMTRAQVAFTADPTEQLGLRSADAFFKELWTSYFGIAKVEVKNKKGAWVNDTSGKIKNAFDLESWELRGGLVENFTDMNSALFGRDWSTGKAWTYDQVKDKGRVVDTFTESQKNTILPKMVEILQPIDWTDSLFARVDRKSLIELYKLFNDSTKGESGELLKSITRRPTVETPRNKYIDVMIDPKNDLSTSLGRQEIAEDVARFTKLVSNLSRFKERAKTDNTIDKRYHTLGQIAERGNDYLTNDLTDMITVKRLFQLLPTLKQTEIDNLSDIHQKVKRVKTDSYLMSKNRQNKGSFPKALTVEENKVQKLFDRIVEEFKVIDEDWYRHMRGLEKGEQRSVEMDQGEIDTIIRDYKKTLTSNEQVAFDYFMLGSLDRGPRQAVDKLRAKIKSEGRMTPLIHNILRGMYSEAASTSLSTLGYASKAVHPASKQDFLLDFAKMSEQAWTPISAQNIKATQQEAIKLKDIQKVKSAGKQIEFDIEPTIDPEIEGSLIEDMSHFSGLAKGELTKEQSGIITELVGHLKHYNHKIGHDLNAFVRGVEFMGEPLIGKDLNAMNGEDYRVLNRYFRDLEKGTIFNQMWRKPGPPDLEKRFYMLMPESTDRDIMTKEIEIIKSKGVYANKFGEVKLGEVAKAGHHLGAMMDWGNLAADTKQKKSEQYVQRHQTELSFLDGIEPGEAIYEMSVALREVPVGDYILKQSRDGRINPKLARYQAQPYFDGPKEVAKKIGWENIKDKKFTVNIGEERPTLTGEQLVEKVIELETAYFKDVFQVLSGREGSMKEYEIGFYDKDTRQNPIVDAPKFIAKMKKNYQDGLPLETDVGVDGLRKVGRSQHIESVSLNPKGKEIRTVLQNWQIRDTNAIPFEQYFPHYILNKKTAESALLNAIDFVKKSGMKGKEQDDLIRKLSYKYNKLTGDWAHDALLDWPAANEMLDNIGKKQALKESIIKWTTANQKMGSMHARDTHIPGYSRGRASVEMYTRDVFNTYYKLLAQVMGRDIISTFQRGAIDKGWHKIKEPGDESSLMDRWTNFYRLYMQDALGDPVIVPDKMLNDPKMKIAGTPYAWWADNKVRDRVNKIAKNLGLVNTRLPENLQGISLQQLRHWSMLEGKYEFLTLLTHPKTVINNLFGGQVHNIMSAGFENLRHARNPEWLKANLPDVVIGDEKIDWSSRGDREKFINFHGVFPEFIRHEAMQAAGVSTAKTKQFVEAATKLMVERPEGTISDLRDLNKQYRVTESAFKKIADVFMGKPERILRTDSFMSHYVHWWKKLGGAIKDPNHPFLIELAKRGVKATQFLYSAPNRPAFSRSALGKVMTRFQLWAWNAARFRYNTARLAKIHGFREGTAAGEKFKRMMTGDLFMIAMANIFVFSMFDNQLPAPWSWLQDTSQWLLGDEKEREKAFFGSYPTSVAPLQLVTPSFLRLGPSALRAWLDDDWGKLADYQLWSMIPMGRIGRSLAGPGNLFENPYRTIEQLTGFPFLQGAAEVAEDLPPEEMVPGFRGLM